MLTISSEHEGSRTRNPRQQPATRKVKKERKEWETERKKIQKELETAMNKITQAHLVQAEKLQLPMEKEQVQKELVIATMKLGNYILHYFIFLCNFFFFSIIFFIFCVAFFKWQFFLVAKKAQKGQIK